ncbi:MAG: M16 family metallopeptidase [Bradymonadia bacterium]
MILVEHRAFPLVNLNLYFRVGPALDPPGKSGLTTLTLRALLRGTSTHGRAELEEAFESLGTEVFTTPMSHTVSIGGAVLTRNLEPFVDLLAQVVTEPAFDAGEIEKVKREMLAEIEARRNEDGRLVGQWFRRLVFEGHPMGNTAGGKTADLEGITREDVVAHHKAFFSKANLLVGASGDVAQSQLEALLDARLGGLPTGETANWSMAEVPALTDRRAALIDKPGRSQAQIYMGHPAVSASDPDYLALYLANTAFGGTFTSRLMKEIRVERGWSYGAYARLGVEISGGYFGMTAAPKMEYAERTMQLMIDEFTRFVDEGLDDEEIEFARGYLINAYPFSVETPQQQMAQRVHARLLGRPDDYVDTYLKTLETLTPDQVRDAVRRRLSPKHLVMVMVCTAPEIRDRVADLPGVDRVTLHPYNAEQ